MLAEVREIAYFLVPRYNASAPASKSWVQNYKLHFHKLRLVITVLAETR